MTRIDLTTTKSVKLKTQGKYCAEDIQVVPNLETVNVTPTTAEQNFSVGSGFSGIGDVKVGAIQTEQTTIKTNGTHTPSAGKFFDKVVVDVADIPAVLLQDKEVTPTKETQIVMADTGYDGLNSTTVKPIPEEYIIPAGELEITENDTYDVTDKKTVIVNVPTGGGGSNEKDPNETMYEMQEADYMRYLQGQIIRNDIPSDAEYLEQQEYVNSAIAIIMGEEF